MLLVEKQLPGVIFLPLHPDAVFPGRNSNITKSQIDVSLKGCGGVSPNPPQATWFQLGEPLFNGLTLQRGLPILHRNRFPRDDQSRSGPGVLGVMLRKSHSRKAGHHQHTQRSYCKFFHFILLLTDIFSCTSISFLLVNTSDPWL
jgi:hypothetical protein